MNWKLIPALLLCFLLLASIPQSPVAASNSENISDDSQKQTLSLPETSTSVQVENNLSGTSTIVGGPENYPEFSEFDSAMERSAETLDNFAATLQKLFNTLPRLGEAILAENGKDEIFGAYDPWAENYKQTLQRLKDSTPKMIDAFDNLVEKLSIFASNGVIPDTYVPVLEKEVVRLRGWFDNLIMAADGLADHLSRLRRDTLENCEALGQITDEISNSIQKVRDAINQLVVPEDLLNLSENSDTTTGAILGENDEPEVGLRPENIPELERYNEAVISFAGAMDDFGVVIAVLDYILPLFRDFGPTESLGEVLPLYEQQLSEYELTLQTLKEVLSEKEDSFSALIARFSEFAAAGALSIDEVQELEEIAIDHGKWAENLTAAADELADRLNTIYDSVTENSNSSCINIAKEILNDGLHSLVNAWETLTGPTDGTCALTAWVSNSTPEPGQPVTLYVQVYHDCERQADDHRLTGSVCATIPGLGSVSIGSFDLGYLSSTTLTREFTAPQTAGDYSIGVTASYTHTWSTLETIWVPYYYTYTWTEVVTRKVWVQKTVTELVWFPGVPQPILVTHTVWVEEERTEYITHEETVFGGYRQEQIRRSHSESGDEYKSASFKVRQPDVTPPTISNVSHLPEPPEKDDLVHVFADISDDIAVDSVALIYYNGAIDSVTMWRISGDERSGTYGCYIPEQPPGVTVFCIIHACDRAGNETTQSFSYVVKGRIETTLSIEDFKCTFEGGLPFGPAWHVSFKAYLRDDSGQPVAGKKIGLYREDEGPLLVTSPGYFTVAELITGDDGRTSVFIFYVDKLDVPAIGGGALELDICHSTGYFHVKFKGDDLYEESESKSVEIPPTGSSPATALPVNSGIYTGSLNETDNEDYYKTYVNGGQTIAISMTPGCDFDLYLYDPEKNLVASSTRRGDSLTESIIYTATMLGDHYIRIHWISGLGTYSLAIDKTPPTIPSIEENHCGRTWTNYGSPYWYWSASDPETRIARYEVYCSWVDNTFYTTDASYHPTLMDGSHHIKVRAQNGAEIWSSWSPAVWVYIDTVPPTSEIEPLSPYWRNDLPLSIIAIASDDGSGVDNATLWYRYSSDNLIWQPWIKSNTDNREPWSWLFDAPCGDGYYEFYSIAVDVAGNFEQPPEDADTTCGVDTTPPVSSVDSIFPYWRKSTHFTITTTTSDSIPSSGAVPSGLKQVELLYRYSTDNTTWGEWASYSVDNEEPWTWSFSAPYGDGYYGFFTVATDIALNAENEPSKPDTYVGVDTLAPVSSVDSIAPYWQNAGMVPFKITATASDPIPSSEAIPSGLKQAELFYRYSTDNSTWDEWASYGINNAAPWSWSFDAPERDGYYEFYTLATDIALNVEAAPERADLNLGVDTTPPVSSVDQIEPYWQETVPFEVSVKALDALSGVAGVELYFRSSIDNVSWTGWKLFNVDNVTLHEWSFVAPDGYALYEFYSVATDAALNVEKTPEVADASCGAVIPATIDIDPDTLNLKSQGRWITAYIEFPADYDLENIIISTIGLESVVPAELHPAEIGDHDGDGILDLMVKFDRSRVQTLLEPGDEVDLTITGIWHAVRFKGTDTIRMIDRGQGQENGHGRDHGNRPEVPPGQSGEHSNNNPEQPPGQSNQGNQGQGNQGGNGGSGQGQGNGNQGKGKG